MTNAAHDAMAALGGSPLVRHTQVDANTAYTLADAVAPADIAMGRIYPSLANIRDVSAKIATADEARVDVIGTMAFDSDEPMRRDTVFRIASMTKPVLAAATMMLVEDGRLTLDEPVDRLLPELADRRVLRRVDVPLDDTVPAERPITVADLLTFRLGFGHLFAGDDFNPPAYPIFQAVDELELRIAEPDPRTPHAPDEWMRRFGTLPLMYQPGSRWQYNMGSLVLGVLVARAAGQPLGEFFAERIFRPLGMASTGFETAAELPAYYMTDPATGEMQQPVAAQETVWSKPPAFPSGAGGLASTADDFLAFARLLLNGGVYEGRRLLSEESVRLMTTNHLTDAQRATGDPILAGNGWGYGVAVVTSPDDVSPIPGRYGWSGGYGTNWFNHPGQGVIGIALTQVTDFIFNGDATAFARAALRR